VYQADNGQRYEVANLLKRQCLILVSDNSGESAREA
jgi:hypothetical protein